MWFLKGGTLRYGGVAFFYHSETGQQLVQRSRLTGLDIFSVSQSTKHWPRFLVNMERSVTMADIAPKALLKSTGTQTLIMEKMEE